MSTSRFEDSGEAALVSWIISTNGVSIVLTMMNTAKGYSTYISHVKIASRSIKDDLTAAPVQIAPIAEAKSTSGVLVPEIN